MTRGVVFVHSAPAAICPHVEWAISGITGARVSLAWTAQPAAPGSLRADASWSGKPGTGARLAEALKAWPMLRFEVTEEASPGIDGERICHVPGRGIWRSAISANGDVVLGEDQLRSLLASAPTLTRFTTSWATCSARTSTPNSSRSAAPARVPPSPGCIRSGDRPRRPTEPATLAVSVRCATP